MITDLGKTHPDLEGILLIEGRGLTSNVYVILGQRVALVDTGSGPPDNPLLPQLEKRGIDMRKINNVLITHAHPDHAGGLIEFVSLHDMTIRVHPAGVDLVPPGMRVEPLRDGDSVSAGHLTLKAIYTPGHSSESLCLYNPAYQILFSGDTAFPGGSFGRTDLPTGDGGRLLESLRRLSQLPVRHLLPGHEKPVVGEGLVHLRASLRSAEAFVLDEV